MKRLHAEVVDALGRRSKVLFGERLRLPLAFVIADDDTGMFTQTDLAEALGVRNGSSVVNPVNHLVAAGFVHRLEANRNERVRWLQRKDDLFWEFVRQQAQIALAPPADDLKPLPLPHLD